MSTDIAIIQPDNINAIIADTPAIYQKNKTSHQKCISVGNQLLDDIKSQGLTDELDKKAAEYVEKSRKTAKFIKEARTPLTKLFDEVRKAFTTFENDIDPNKQGSVPYQVQQHRNAYAAQKRAEQEARQREALARQRAETIRTELRLDITENIKQQFQKAITDSISLINAIDKGVTLQNYEVELARLQAMEHTPSQFFLSSLRATTSLPEGVSVPEFQAIETSVKQELLPKLIEQYTFEVGETKTFILDRLPSKREQLLQIEQANAEETKRIQQELEAKQRQEDERIKAERAQREEKERQEAEAQRQVAEMASLFNQQATIQGYQPKTKVSKKIELLKPEGIFAIITMWWSKEGHNCTTEELNKLFKKQITCCEKAANKDGEFIQDESVNYIDDIKAK